jgi:hypothetical protein
MINTADKIRNIKLVYYKGSKRFKTSTIRTINRKISFLLASLNWGKWSRIEITVRYAIGTNSMTLKNKSDAMWCLTAFVKEYES